MIRSLRTTLIVVSGALGAAAALAQAEVASRPGAGEVGYARSADKLLVSFREIWPELADQDPTPQVRVFGDGRVVVHRPAYMKRSGVFEMYLSRPEVDQLLLELTPSLLAFDEAGVRAERRVAEAARRAAAADSGEPTLFHVADAELTIFDLDVDSYGPPGSAGPALPLPAFRRSWRGLRYDAERYPDVEPIQALMRAERTLRALTERRELSWVAPATR